MIKDILLDRLNKSIDTLQDQQNILKSIINDIEYDDYNKLSKDLTAGLSVKDPDYSSLLKELFKCYY